MIRRERFLPYPFRGFCGMMSMGLDGQPVCLGTEGEGGIPSRGICRPAPQEVCVHPPLQGCSCYNWDKVRETQ